MRIASCSTVLKVHEWPEGDIVTTYQPSAKYEGAIRSISWSKDGMWIVIVPINGISEVVSVKEQQPRQLLAIKDYHSTCAAFQNTTKKAVVLGTSTKEVLVYDIKAKQVRKQFDPCASIINHIEYTAKDSHIAAACENGDINLYSNTVNKLSTTFRVPKSTCCTSLRCHVSKRNHILAGSYEGVVALFDTNVSKVMYISQAHLGAVSGLSFSPVNSDLIVSTGLDRRLLFHDASSKIRPAEIAVENTATSVDFAPNGISIAVACQNGKICVYDARKLTTPVNRFEAHSARINKVLFQKIEEEKSSFVLNEEEGKVPTGYEEVNVSSKTGDSFSFSMEMFTGQSPRNVQEEKSQECGDSFMAALGLNMTDSKSALFTSESSTTSTVVMGDPKKTVNKSLPTLKVTHSSTPKLIQQEEEAPELSPVISSSMNSGSNLPVQQVAGVSAEEVRKIFREEFNSGLNKFKKEVAQDLYEVTSQVRRQFLDLHMSIVKEFVQIENNLNRLKQELLVEDPCYSEDMLLQENCRLKRELMLLREKLSKED